MEKIVLSAASVYKQLYYFNPEFGILPNDVKLELKEICVSLSYKLHCIFSIWIYENSDIYIEATAEQTDCNFDEIGSQLEIKTLKNNKAELFLSINLWYLLYRTKTGKPILNYILES